MRILAYHGIDSYPTNSYTVKLDNFEDQMKYLEENYHVISLLDYLKILENNVIYLPNTVVVTFDDGFKNFYNLAYPILKKYQIPATCFVITSKTDLNIADFMCWSDLREIMAEGLVNIGSHTVSHRPLSKLTDEELTQEIFESKDII